MTRDDIDSKYIIDVDGSFISKRTGRQVTTTDDKGYLTVRHKYKKYRVHRIIFFYFKGYFPETVDHKDGDIRNNSLSNLRDATRSINRANTNKTWAASGLKGVVSMGDGYRAEIQRDGIRKRSKRFDTPAEAAMAYEQYRLELYPELYV